MYTTNEKVIIRAPFCVKSGYETLSDTICIELSKMGYEVYPLSINGEITNPLVQKLVKPTTKELFNQIELCILPVQADCNDYNVYYRIPKIGKRIFFTMWESTQLSMNVIELLNTGIKVIVPNQWNLENFKNDGVIIPIEKCPLFVDTNIFNYSPQLKTDYFTFGTANADPRKRINEVIRCFCKAFSPTIKDVKMKIKISPEDNLTRFTDNRLQINALKLTKKELVNWYHSIDVLVSGVSAEGWGLMQHEAMACGRPIIATEYAGLKEFFNENVGFPVKYTEVPAEWSWKFSNGFWSKFDEDDMIDKMRYCYNNREEVIRKGKKSSIEAKKLDITNFVNKLTKILKP